MPGVTMIQPAPIASRSGLISWAEATRGVPVLILSNSSREQDIAEVNRLGVSGYFVKSNLSLQALGELVGRVLDGQSA